VREQSLVEIGVRTATGDEKRCFCSYVCMFVTLDVLEGGPDIQQHIMSLFVDQFQCGFHYFLQKETAFPSSNCLQRFQLITRWRHSFPRNGQKFSKTDRKVCENDFDHFGAHIIKVRSGLCSHGIIDVHLYNFFQIALYV